MTIQQTKKLLSCNQYVQYDTLGPNHRHFYCIDVVVGTGAGVIHGTHPTDLQISLCLPNFFWGQLGMQQVLFKALHVVN